MLYRKGVIEDTEQILVLGRQMHKESAFADLDWSDIKAANLFKTCVSNPNYCCFVVEKNGFLVGMIAGKVSEYFFGHDKILSDFVWFVDQENRGTMASIRLLKMFIGFGKKWHVAEVCIGVSTQVLLDRTDKLLKKFDFENVGGTYKLMMEG
tara:strand:+ start:170 stop:625 length:456 start_codon:yes stop_codon:yes gene_type:complete